MVNDTKGCNMTNDKIIDIFNQEAVCGVIVQEEDGEELTVNAQWVRDNIDVCNITEISYIGDEFEIEEIDMVYNNKKIKLLAV